MTKKKVYIWADADVKIGYGHFIRSLALADMLKEDFDCTFFTQSPTDYQIKEVEKVCKLYPLPSDDGKFDNFLGVLSGEEIVVLDNYFFTSKFELMIKEKGCRVITISPLRLELSSDVVVYYVARDMTLYSVNPKTLVLAGLQWIVLRRPFYFPVCTSFREKGRVVISFGGTDQFCLMEKVLDFLPEQYKVHILCSSRVNEKRISAFQKKGIVCHVDVPAEDVATLFDSSELAILSSSTICLEALSRGCRVLAGYYVDNQCKLYESLLSSNLIKGLGDMLADSFPQRLLGALDGSFDMAKLDFFSTKSNYVRLLQSL